jgi:hypothetical protein
MFEVSKPLENFVALIKSMNDVVVASPSMEAIDNVVPFVPDNGRCEMQS